jgi:hypothetical protein
MFVNSASNNYYIGLAGDNRDYNESDQCGPYGVKSIQSIEWNDRNAKFVFSIANFSSHSTEKLAPSTPLHFALKADGDDWVGDDTDKNSAGYGFNMVLHRKQ